MEQHSQGIQERTLQTLIHFLSIPSISADPNYKWAIQKAADFLTNELNYLGFDNVQTIQTAQHPVVFAEKIIDSNAPTLLFYGHYDVQPAEENSDWISPPFEPTIRDNNIYARGACDDKAQVLIIIHGIATALKEQTLKCNVKFIFEGEEEIGSPSMDQFIQNNRTLIEADSFIVCDTAMPDSQHPTLINGLRGICYWELNIQTNECDLHSGMHDGPSSNAALEMSRLLSSLKTETNEIAFIKTDKPSSSVSETSILTVPSFEINGMWSGYLDKGPKTIIPCEAGAKFSYRIPYGSFPTEIHEQMTRFIRSTLSSSTTFHLELLAGAQPVLTTTDNYFFSCAKEALCTVFDAPVETKHIGGTIPIVSLMQERMGYSPILLGFGLDSDNIHAPNESFSLDHFAKGMETVALFQKLVAKQASTLSDFSLTSSSEQFTIN